MRILHCIYDHTGNPWVGGGGAVRARELNLRLAEKHDVTIICGQYPSATDYKEANLQFRFVGSQAKNYVWSIFAYAWQASRFLLAHAADFDLLIEDFAAYNPLFSFRHTKQAVLQVHQKEGFHILRKYLLLGLPFYFLEKVYPKFFVNSLTVSATSKKKFSLPFSSPVIPNGFDGNYLSVPASREEEYVLFLGRIEFDSKGLDILLDAWTRLPDTPLRIAGKGKDENKLADRIAALKLADRITLPGYVRAKEKIDSISRCTIMVVPSRFEAQGIVVLEAAALGKPVVVSDIPELAYAVEAGFGISFRTGDAVDLTEKIDHLQKDAFLRKEMGKKAREYAKDYTWDRIAETYEKFLLSVKKKD